ncbi:hypothetical protein J6590_007388 [Homalodisca vitripennis]|nr:hypothetical protein J6590_007388 [Homalodisca vitripennis]
MECDVKVEWPRGKAKDEDDGCPRKAWLKRDKTVLWRMTSSAIKIVQQVVHVG